MKLTERQEGFAQAIVNGKSKVDAYRAFYSWENYTTNALNVQVNKLYNRPNVFLRITELRKELVSINHWSREESIEALKSVISDHDRKSEVVAAVKELNAMHGYNAPIKTETISHVFSLNFDDFYDNPE